MPVDHTEKGFEQAIEDHLLHHGYRNGDPANFDASLALDTKTLVEFLGVTQKDEWGRLNNSNNSGDTILNFSELGQKIDFMPKHYIRSSQYILGHVCHGNSRE